MGVAHVLQSGYPNMTPTQAVMNAEQMIRGLHQLGLEVGPLAAFGPQAAMPFDALDLAAYQIEIDQGRKPWLPEWEGN